MRELVAPLAQRHNDPIVRAVADFVPTLYARRLSLQAPFFDRDGNLIMPAMPRLLVRPPALRGRSKGIERGAFDYRRADGMAAICRVLTAMAAWCNWTTQEVRDPVNGYVGVEQLARDAQCSIDQVERSLYWLRAAKIVCHTKQFREEKPDGSFHSTGNALRKLAVEWFESIPSIRRIFHHRRAKLKERLGKHRGRAARYGLAAAILDAPAPAAPAPAPHQVVRSIPPVELTDAIQAEHPEWSAVEIFAEARRRQALGP